MPYLSSFDVAAMWCLEESTTASFPKAPKGVRGRRRKVRVAVDASGVMMLNE